MKLNQMPPDLRDAAIRASTAVLSRSASIDEVAFGINSLLKMEFSEKPLTLYGQAIARVCHQVNKAYCEALGDNSQPDWEDAPEWQKKSALQGVRFHIEGGMAHTPEDSHRNWLAAKVADGWVYGPVKDAEKKEHPCMVPYAELPEAQRVKDALFIAVIKALA